MSENRLLPQQFGPGVTLDGTRIEASLRELVRLFNDVPADLVGRRWSCSPMVWGMTPPVLGSGATHQLPFMRDNASYVTVKQVPGDLQNPWRGKSSYVSTEFVNDLTRDKPNVSLWETTIIATRPLIIGNMTVTAEYAAGAVYTNDWTWKAGSPAPHNAGDPTENFQLQVCLSDAWDIENRRKLRQEALVYKTRSDAFRVYDDGVPIDKIVPERPAGSFQGMLVEAKQAVLVPAGARVVLQWCVVTPRASAWTSWGIQYRDGNVWTLSADVWGATK